MNRRTFLARMAPTTGVLTLIGARLNKLAAQSERQLGAKSGVVLAVDRDLVYLNASPNPITVKIKSSTRIWKGADGVDIRALRPGDEVAMRGVAELDGAFTASEMWINIVSLDGVVASLKDDMAGVQVVRNGSTTEMAQVRLTNKTMSSQMNPMKKENVQIGRTVRVIGLALEDGTIEATRFIVYVDGRPVDSRATKYVDPATGKIIDKR